MSHKDMRDPINGYENNIRKQQKEKSKLHIDIQFNHIFVKYGGF